MKTKTKIILPQDFRFRLLLSAVLPPLVAVSNVTHLKPTTAVVTGGKDAVSIDYMVHQNEEFSKHEMEELKTVMAEAKEYMCWIDAKLSTPDTFLAVEDILKDLGESKDQHPSLNSDAFHLHTSINQNLSNASSGISVVVQAENSCGTETMSEDEVSFISPVAQEENACGTETMLDNEKEVPDDIEASATYSVKCEDEQEDGGNHKKYINLEVAPHDHPQGHKVMAALKLFKEEYDKLLQEHGSEPGGGKGINRLYLAYKCVKKKGMNFIPDKPFGHIPGIKIGDEFSLRAELAVVGLNCQFICGIDYVKLNEYETQYATSVVDSGQYENKATEHDILIYSGQGGNPNIYANGASDQKLERGNLALVNNMEKEFPVRVIRKRKGLTESNILGVNDKRKYVYVYDGLYKVNNYWRERDTQNGKLVYKFELQRLPGQPRIRVITDCYKPLSGQRRNHGTDVKGRKQVIDICVLNDLSQGKEKYKVRAMNGVDDDHPPPFTYTTNIVYQHLDWLSVPVGCDCVNGCSDSVQCPCVKKNGGEIPYTEKGSLMKAKTNGTVHECGPSCKCPPSCMNRVSQGGPRFQLEIFKTKSMGWGVRSRDYIMPGSFICEYIGEILSESEANKRIDKDEYLFDICHGKSQEDDFSLDAAKYGNIGRFINHSCDPNVFSQEVLYDHDDKRMPHIMFFASKRIPPSQELMLAIVVLANVMAGCTSPSSYSFWKHYKGLCNRWRFFRVNIEQQLEVEEKRRM
ncbi:[histone H3]-lysine(4) N-trimethyltransferase [Salvia divinorum]|uniref:[histone H3]-lysine(4) N-trimethyltransferase n=1 Tax=Salvia divinorum TaxID=28513 RepID=A0ABD1FQN1_SALDI